MSPQVLSCGDTYIIYNRYTLSVKRPVIRTTVRFWVTLSVKWVFLRRVMGFGLPYP